MIGEPVGDGKTCLREHIDPYFLFFVNEKYRYYSKGKYPNNYNVWYQANKEIEITEILDSYYGNA